MWGLFPFFYYDVLARIIPGAFTLAVALMLSETARRWTVIFAGKDSWQAIGVPLVLGGLSYVIGVMYEALGSIPFPLPRDCIEKKAFERARKQFIDETPNRNLPADLTDPSGSWKERGWRTQLWEKLVYEAARKDDMVSVLWHCHRFQGESKMFYHLFYPTLVLFFGSFFQCQIYTGIVAIFLMVGFVGCAFARDKRRWWQLLSFAEQLGWLKNKTLVTPFLCF
jgi:hypothetical protein